MDDIIRKRALAGDMDALSALTEKLIRRGNSKNENIAINMITDAYNALPSVAADLGNQLLNGSPLFEKDHDIALSWIAFSSNKRFTPFTGTEPASQTTAQDNGSNSQDSSAGASPDVKATTPLRRIEASTAIDPFQELNSLIGLQNVKNEITEQTSLMQFESIRKKSGLPAVNPSVHFIFTGNPGTGKTTVARIVGSIFKKIGHLQSGHVIEVSIPDMIGQYVGETPQKVLAALQAARGGVLFIDEAYGLLSSQSGGGDAYGEQAITTILKFMEDNRDNITIIAAGYPDKMKIFLESNPGFKSRFTEIIFFEDYKQDELHKIYMSCIEEQTYKASDAASVLLLKIMGDAPKIFSKDFPNARFVRNLFEGTIKYMALRVMKIKEPSRDDLITITEDDINQAYKEEQKKAGFQSSGTVSGGDNKDTAKYGYQ